MKSKKRANAKGKGKEKAVEMEEVESKDEISGEEDHITQQRDTSAKKIGEQRNMLMIWMNT